MQKICRLCGESKALEDFPIEKRNRDGRGARCRPCYRATFGEATKRWQVEHSERVKATKDRSYQRRRVNPEFKARSLEADRRWKATNKPRKTAPKPPVPEGSKFCIGCQQVLPVTNFAGDKRLKDGLRGRCRPCHAAIVDKDAASKWARENPELAREAHRIANARRHQRPEFIARRSKYSRQYAGEHLLDKVVRENRRRAMKASARVNDLTVPEWETLKAAFEQRCAYCSQRPKVLTQDHVAPLRHGGWHTAPNIVPACRSCNAKKGARQSLPLQVLPVFLELMLYKH